MSAVSSFLSPVSSETVTYSKRKGSRVLKRFEIYREWLLIGIVHPKMQIWHQWCQAPLAFAHVTDFEAATWKYLTADKILWRLFLEKRFFFYHFQSLTAKTYRIWVNDPFKCNVIKVILFCISLVPHWAPLLFSHTLWSSFSLLLSTVLQV